MGLETIVEEIQSQPENLRALILTSFREERETAPLGPTSFLRASEFGYMCPREEVIVSKKNLTRKKDREANDMLQLLQGSGIHWALQNILLPKVCDFLGIWTCLDCKQTFGDDTCIPRSLTVRPLACVCGGKEFLYREISLRNEKFRISGHPDGFLILAKYPGVGIIEIKTIGAGWEVKQCPLMEHVIQIQLYMWLTDLEWGKILYWDKKVQGEDSIIEHHVVRDPDTIAEIKHLASSVWRGLEEDGPLPARVCVNSQAPRAKKCAVAKPCFANEFIPAPF